MRFDHNTVLPVVEQAVQAAPATARAEARRVAKESRRTSTKAAHALLAVQAESGYWCGDLTADSTLNSDYILLQLWLYPPENGVWNPPTRRRIEKAIRWTRECQLPDGGWNIYAGGPSEINATARAYATMKIAGVDPNEPFMRKACARVIALGGLQAANSYTKINFSLFGLYPREFVPSVPPEIMLVPGKVLYEMSSWTRSIVVPLSIVQSVGKQRPVPAGVDVQELLHPRKKLALPRKDRFSSIFNHADRLVKIWERRGLEEVRKSAIRQAEHWMLDRMQYTEGLGAIYPGMMYSIMAMEALGYERDHPDLVTAIQQFDDLLLETEDRLQFQPCKSPVWDTAITAFALGELGEGDPAALTRATDWLLEKEVRRKGDWAVKRPDLTPGGWAFEFANEYYPDIDDTAMVLLAMMHGKASDPEKQERAERRAVNWLLGMQSKDGGWAAFDVDNNWQLLNRVPFADHNAMLDPTCPDITGRVMESLCRRGFTYEHPAIRNGAQYLLAHQKENGSWYGRWGVNYVYGTFLALRGLRASAAPIANGAMDKAARWLKSVQNSDGGWGESCSSYVQHTFMKAESTPSQTAWAILGLAAAGEGSSAAARRGVEWLMERQRPDGTWDESLTTGTGFPNVFYLTYHMYRNYFPLLAVAAFQKANREAHTATA